jgi:tetratricopeptide (TPR) repeat protein
VEQDVRQPDATVYERSTLSGAHENLGNVLGNPDELNLGDRAGAVSHARLAVEIAEGIGASDRHDVRARDDTAGARRTLGAILLEAQPSEALKCYQTAATISEALGTSEPSNTKYPRDLALARAGIGEALHRLGKNGEALQALAPALDGMKAVARAESDELYLIGEVSRIHQAIGNVLSATGDEKRAYDNYRQGLVAGEELIRRAPASLYFQRRHADALESLGRYHLALARRRSEHKTEARLWLQKSLTVWQDWTRRKLAAPYAGVREAQAAKLLASIDKL